MSGSVCTPPPPPKKPKCTDTWWRSFLSSNSKLSNPFTIRCPPKPICPKQQNVEDKRKRAKKSEKIQKWIVEWQNEIELESFYLNNQMTRPHWLLLSHVMKANLELKKNFKFMNLNWRGRMLTRTDLIRVRITLANGINRRWWRVLFQYLFRFFHACQ